MFAGGTRNPTKTAYALGAESPFTLLETWLYCQPMASPKLDQFVAQCSQLATQLGIAEVVIAARDPESKETRLVASPDGMRGLKEIVGTKFGFEGDESSTGYPGSQLG